MDTFFPIRNRLVPIIHATPDTIFLGDYGVQLKASEPLLAWFNELSGDQNATHALETFLDQFGSKMDSSEIQRNKKDAIALIAHGFKSAALLDLHAIPALARWSANSRPVDMATSAQTHAHATYPDTDHLSIAKLIDVRSETPIAILGENKLAHQIRNIAIRENWQVISSEQGAACVIFVSESHPDVCDHDSAPGTRRTHLHVAARHGRCVVGPMVTPGESSCLRCAYLHARDKDVHMPQRTIDWRNSHAYACADPHISAMAAHFALLVVRAWIDGWDVGNTAWDASLPLGQFTSTPRPVHPLCGCMLGKSTT